jgi:hypothetical protein
MLEVWVSGGLGTQKHKRDTVVYLGSGYWDPTSSSEVFFVFRSFQIRGSQWKFGRGSLGAILQLIDGEVSPH